MQHRWIYPFGGKGLCDKCGLPEDRVLGPECFLPDSFDAEPRERTRGKRDRRDDRVFTEA